MTSKYNPGKKCLESGKMRRKRERGDDQSDQKLVVEINKTDNRLELVKNELSSWINKAEKSKDKPSDTSSDDENNIGFTSHLNKAVETTGWNFENEKCSGVESPKFNSYSNCDSPDLFIESRYGDMSLLPEHKVERLLFKSFLMQLYGSYVSTSDDSDSEVSTQTKSKINRFQKKKSYKLKKNWIRRNRPRNRGLDRSFFISDIEVVDEGDTSAFDSSVQITHSEPLDFDIGMYDWSEDFDLSHTDTTQDLSVICIDSPAKNSKENETIDIDGSDSIEEIVEKNSSKDISARDSRVKQSKEATSTNSMETNVPKIADQQKVWECPICYEESSGQEIVATVCGHIYCKMCIGIHTTNISKFCPTCSCDLTDKPLITLYNI